MPKVLAFIRRELLWRLSTPLTLIMPFLSIAIAVTGFAYMSRLVDPHTALQAGGRHVPYLTYVVVNLAFMLLLTTALEGVSQSLRTEQLIGTLEPIISSGTSNTMVIVASSAWSMLFGIAQAAFYFLVALLFGVRFDDVNVGSLVTFVLLGIACMSSFGVLGAAMVITFRQTPPSTILVGGAASLLTGVLFPISLLPPWLRTISWLLPMTHALNGFRAAMLGEGIGPNAMDALWLVVVTAILLPLSLVVFRRALYRARFDGTLANY